MNYLLEWQQSCVDEQLTNLNVTSIEGDCAIEHLLYAESLPRDNKGEISDYYLKLYAHTEDGGWWCSGVDLLTGKEDTWGCFKPSQPRFNQKKKLIKYEHPPKVSTGVFALKVPLKIWQKISDRYGVKILPEDINYHQPDIGFWQWLIENPSVPLCITEGAKKAGALLSAGYAAIALPGINGGYRVPKNILNNSITKHRLIPQLKKLAIPTREIYIVFDQDSKPNTIKAVETAISRFGTLLQQNGCLVKVITWNHLLGKGVDDLIANQGQNIFDKAYQKALELELWKAKCLTRLTYTPSLEIDCRYIPTLSIPEDAQLIAIKSPKGTGKTKFLESIVKEAINNQKWVLVIGHRIKLVEQLCQRFGLKYITEIRDNAGEQLLGYGLCVDSLHLNSVAKFDADNWHDGIVIIDEIEQVIWHGLNSSTCQKNRVSVLKSLKILMENVLAGDGKVFVADADLSNISLDYIISLAGVDIEPFVINNLWQPSKEDSCKVYNYTETTPKRLLKDLVSHIQEGGKPFVCLSAQKLTSQWGTCTLEAYLKKQFPQRKILRIDSESLSDPEHPAYGCLTNLNQILGNYDIILASPSIETGISIDLTGYFTSVWGIAQGVQTVNSVCQSLGRVRENIPRYVWAAKYGFNRIGNGATSIAALLASSQRLTQLNILLLQQVDFASFDELDTNFQAESLLCWAKMAVRINAAMLNYRDSIVAVLIEEGSNILSPQKNLKEKEKESKNCPLTEAITAVKEQNYQVECQEIALAGEISDRRYQQLKKHLFRTSTERRILRKYDLTQRYGVIISPELVALDDQGWYRKIRLHYFLTVGRMYLADRDAKIAKKMLEQGQGSLFIPDFNNSQMGAIIGTMEVLGIPQLLGERGKELCNTDLDLIDLAQLALHHRYEIKLIVGIKIAKNASPITIARQFLGQMGFSLKCIACRGEHQKRIRIYQVIYPQDRREEVFEYWLTGDRIFPGIPETWQDYIYAKLSNNDSAQPEHIQLSLDFDN